jgi:hypothetical protein
MSSKIKILDQQLTFRMEFVCLDIMREYSKIQAKQTFDQNNIKAPECQG